eukprot:CAMPEP_0118672500 /NCGR_PEP_ID=MMETSP0785-20121206/22574_1 /TAXON_ID=91992 /ORGANISM="Bolidomonas pacifica, Strain CCMP 1866" /LENGTH=791 /DNA_ID=CAMNT_0006567467 /DNA_START=16 /DNA_END=2388 /DNA_ORIENTATION=+
MHSGGRSTFKGPTTTQQQAQTHSNTHTNPSGFPGAPSPSTNTPPPSQSTNDSYFTDARRGEVSELRTLLKTFPVERSLQRRRDVIKKVIAYMTLGIDVSRLFPEMILAVEDRDLVIKKMVYLYLTTYAQLNPDMSQMCVNTLQKDTSNDDPIIRGLALRSLCSLRVSSMMEYVIDPLRRSLQDSNSYVRKTAVMGVLKLHDLDKESVSGLMDQVRSMVSDRDTLVVVNVIRCLNEIDRSSGGMQVERKEMLSLLNRITDFDEFGLTEVLGLLLKYKPQGKEEMFAIMNLLDPVLRTSNSGAVLSTIRCFLKLTKGMEGMGTMVCERVKPPLLTLIAGGTPELVYCLLCHLKQLVKVSPQTFSPDYRQLYVRYNEPSHVKYLKVEILGELANEENGIDIITELTEYVSDPDGKLGVRAVKAISEVGCSDRCLLEGGQGGIGEVVVEKLVELTGLDVNHISSKAAECLKDVTRKHHTMRSIVAPVLPRCMKFITDERGLASVVWMMGEFGEIITEAPYALERMIKSEEWEDLGSEVKISLLTASVKLFFKRPGEMQGVLGAVMVKAAGDTKSQELHDRALLYYRLLEQGGEKAEAVIGSTNQNVERSRHFAEDQDEATFKRLREEFNTLSVIYGQEEVHWIQEEFRSFGVEAGATTEETYEDLLGFAAGDSPPPPPMTDLVGGTPPTPPAVELNKSFSIDGGTFQSMWQSLPEACSGMSVATKVHTTGEVEASLAELGVLTMASGEMEAEIKFFLYAQERGGAVYLLQCVIDKTCEPRVVSIVVKTEGGTNAE